MNLNLITLIVVSMVFFAGASAQRISSHRGELVDRIIAQVNDDVITQSELEALLEKFPPQLHRQVAHKILDGLIDRQLLLQEAQRRGIVVATSTVLNYLETTSPTAQQLHYARQQITIELLTMKLFDQIIIPQEVLEQIYEGSQKQLSLYQITSDNEQTISVIRKELIEGAKISTIENKYEGVKVEKLEYITIVEFPPPLASEIEKLHKPNQVTDVIKTDMGYFLFQLIEERNTPQELYPQLIQKYTQAYKEILLQQQLNELLNSLREKAYIKIIE